MDTIEFYLIFFGVLFLIVFIVDYFFINKRKYNLMFNAKDHVEVKDKNNKRKLKKVKPKEFGEINYLINKFKLNKAKIDYKFCIVWVSIINAFIISFVSTVISAIPAATVWQLLVGFVLIFALIYALYEIFGRILVKKGWGLKNE